MEDDVSESKPKMYQDVMLPCVRERRPLSAVRPLRYGLMEVFL